MNLSKLKMESTVAALIILIICGGIAVVSHLTEVEDSKPIEGASIEGDWEQTQTRGLFNGMKTDEIYDSNTLTIKDSGNGHFFSIVHRGVDGFGVRYGDIILWQSTSSEGRSLVLCNAYGNCLVVNEIYYGTGLSDQIYVNASLYTKNGVTPAWFDYWDGGNAPAKWAIFSADAIDIAGTTAELSGHYFYFTTHYGPVFAGELQQFIDGETVPTTVHGTMISMSDDGAFTAVAVDSIKNIWFMRYNGSVFSMNTVAPNDHSALAGEIVGVERDYMELTDSSLPSFSESIIKVNSAWSLVKANMFVGGQVIENPATGNFYVSHTAGQVFTVTGLTLNGASVNLIGYTIGAQHEGAYYVGAGMYSDKFDNLGTGYGMYNDRTGTMLLSIYTTYMGIPIIAEYEIRTSDYNLLDSSDNITEGMNITATGVRDKLTGTFDTVITGVNGNTVSYTMVECDEGTTTDLSTISYDSPYIGIDYVSGTAPETVSVNKNGSTYSINGTYTVSLQGTTTTFTYSDLAITVDSENKVVSATGAYTIKTQTEETDLHSTGDYSFSFAVEDYVCTMTVNITRNTVGTYAKDDLYEKTLWFTYDPETYSGCSIVEANVPFGNVTAKVYYINGTSDSGFVYEDYKVVMYNGYVIAESGIVNGVDATYGWLIFD